MQLASHDALPSPVELLAVREEQPAGGRLRSDSRYVRVRRGIYAAHKAWVALTPWQRYLARVHAYALINPDAIFSHESAAALLGLPVIGEPIDIHVFDPERARSARYGDVVLHTSQDGRGYSVLGMLNVTDMAHTAIDLARVLPPAFGLAVVDAALARPGAGFELSELADLAAAQDSARGRTRLRWIWQHADPRSESAGESVSRAAIEWLGFEQPELQVELRNEGHLDRVDFAWLRVRVLGESDGYGKYFAADPDETRTRLIDEKRREDRLRRSARGFARWDWAAAMQATPLGEKLHAAGVPQLRHPQRVMLASLRRHPRSFDRRSLVPRDSVVRPRNSA